MPVITAACFRDRDNDPPPGPEPECTAHEDCAYLDDGDECYAPARCDQGYCDREFLQNADDCQCDHELHCMALGFEEQGCNVIKCEDRECIEDIVPQGSSPAQQEGDCEHVLCDGVSPIGMVEADNDDYNDDNNECTVDACGPEGPLNDPVTNGERCGDNGLCYEATCHAGCVPSNPAACGTEGPNEPTNDAGASATSYGEGTEECGMLDADDIDWFTMYLDDEDFEADVMGFELHSTAPSLELCAYVRCNNNGFPEGGCANKENGPQGSIGCCWQGNATDLSPTWDLDCNDTSEDSGTLYFSVRAPNGDDCEGYTVSAHY